MEQNNSVENEFSYTEEPVAEPVPNNAAPAAEPNASAEKPSGVKKTLNLTVAILSMAAIVFSFVFTFLIGIASKIAFFGGEALIIDSLKNIADIFKAITSGGGAETITHLVLGTLLPIFILIAFIIVELVYLILGVLRFIKVIKGEETKSMEKLAVSSYVYYAIAASVIFALSGNVACKFNAATYAGLIIAGLLVSAIVVIKVILRGKDMLKPNNLVPAILVAAAVVFSAVVAGLCCGPIAGDAFPVDVISAVVGTPGKEMTAMLAGFIAIAAIAGFIELIGHFLRYLIDGKLNKKTFTSTVSMFVLMVIGVICLYVGLSGVDGTRFIVAAVFALIVMGCMIAYKIVCKETVEETKPEENANV